MTISFKFRNFALTLRGGEVPFVNVKIGKFQFCCSVEVLHIRYSNFLKVTVTHN